MTNENELCQCTVSLLSTAISKKVVLKRKNSQIHLSVSPVIEEGEPCCLYLEDLFVEKKVFLPRFVRKLFHLQRTNHQSSANSPFLSGAEIQWHFSETVCALSDLPHDAVI